MFASRFLHFISGKFSKTKDIGVFGNDATATNIPLEVCRCYLLTDRPEVILVPLHQGNQMVTQLTRQYMLVGLIPLLVKYGDVASVKIPVGKQCGFVQFVNRFEIVRDKFTHVSRGFAFVHFHSVEDAKKALEATNGIALEKNGQVLRVAYAKSTHGSASGASQSNSLAAAAIEAASFAQQYDAVGWAPKEYNPDDKLNINSESQKDVSAPESGFVWDEKSGYYYDSASGFYYDGNSGLYYDGNAGVWYSYDQQTQQYVPCNEQSNSKAAGDIYDKFNSSHSGTGFSLKGKPKSDSGNAKDMNSAASYNSLGQGTAITQILDSDIKPRPVSNSLGTTIMGVIRGSSRGVIKSDTTFHASSDASSTITTSTSGLMTNVESPTASGPFKTDLSALVSYASSGVSGSAKRRFSEAPGQSQYRDRAAERRSLYGSSSSLGNDNVGLDSTGDYTSRKGSSEIGSMPFPPGVGERSSGEIGNTENFEVITADRAIDETNVGNRILRNMGWQEGLGLGKDGSGIKEPVQAKSVDVRAGLGSQQRKAADRSLEAQAGDSYKTIIQKKAIARFREMS